MPDIVGMRREDATKTLKEFKVKYNGSENNIIYISPEASSFQNVETTITLTLN